MAKKFFVTGASGFLGKALANRLLNDGNEVVCISRTPVPELVAKGAVFHKIDICALPENFPAMLEGIDTVFHTAAKVSMWGDYQDFYATNVAGTENLLAAAKKAGVKRFVYTSSPSVIADGNDLRGIDETYPYPEKFKAYYPQTKSIAERKVLEANGSDFQTLALRPHLIFGPGDTNLTPTVISRAKQGKLVQIGNGNNLVDFTYIDDCVAAHIKASHALETNPVARGRAYFISQGDPVRLWEWIGKVLEYNGIEPVKKKINARIAIILASFAEFFARLFKARDLRLTKFLVSEMATDHYFSIESARNELGYQPQYKVMEALDLTFNSSHGKVPQSSTIAA